ncbi:DUF3169 family protein [Streptococcus rifensis]
MKQGKQLTLGKRILRNVLIFLSGVLGAGILAFLAGFFEGAGIDLDLIFNGKNLQILLRLFVVVLFLAFLILIYRARKSHTLYQMIDEEEDEQLEMVYKQMHRHLEYATIIFNIMSVVSLLLIMMSFSIIFKEDSASMDFQILDFLLTMGILIGGQILVFKTTQKIREYRLSAFPTINEVKDYVYSLDEGEQQVNFEQAFLTVFNLNQRVLPALYVSVFVLDIILQEKQYVAYLVLAIVHVYINVTNMNMVRKYFK